MEKEEEEEEKEEYKVTLLDAFFKFCGNMDDPLEMIYDDRCPDEPSDSANYALFVIKFMETISKKGYIEWRIRISSYPLITRILNRHPRVEAQKG
ncbi:hypothetical protein Taro_010772 [Colocasia esculenta]|uniref:Uncharacterized protein n=1 Tax=Colocasia esculenta TaxID=4460 RepID=A0A843U8P5_COLES|nr:hypothetical protein [Colocasia esculenta]